MRLAIDGMHEGERALVIAARGVGKPRLWRPVLVDDDLPEQIVGNAADNPAAAPSRAMPTAMLRHDPPATGTIASRPSSDFTGRKSISASPQLSSISEYS